ncbi:MAG: Crp/Fnr family transcriptional regulator [Thermoleophilia bacterium]
MHRADGLSVQPSPWREAAPHGRLPLERVDFLRGVHPQDLGRLEQLLPPVSWVAGRDMPAELRRPGCVFVVRGGRIAILGRDPGARATMMVAFGDPGDLYSTLGGVPAPRAMALEDTAVTALPETVLRTLARRHPQLGVDLSVSLSERVALLRDVVAHVGHSHIDERLWARIVALIGRVGVATAAGPLLPIPLTHAQWGMLTGGSRESITLALGRFRREGRIQVRDRRILVPWTVWRQAATVADATLQADAAPHSARVRLVNATQPRDEKEDP